MTSAPIPLTPAEWKLVRHALSVAPAKLPGVRAAQSLVARAPKRLDGSFVLRPNEDERLAITVALKTYSQTPQPRAREARTLQQRLFPQPSQLTPQAQQQVNEAQRIPGTPFDTFQAQVLGLCGQFILETVEMWPSSYRADVKAAAETLQHAFLFGVPSAPEDYVEPLALASAERLSTAYHLLLGQNDVQIGAISAHIQGAVAALGAYLGQRSQRQPN